MSDATTQAKTEYIIEPGKQEFTVSRWFDAPPELVWKAFTDPELVPQWWGPAQYKTEIEEMDVRPGGRWRYLHESPQASYAFRGVYHEVIEPKTMLSTFEFEPVPGHVSMVRATFEPVDDGTRLVQHQVFETLEDRDGMVGAGMQEGNNEGMDRLAELLERMK